MRPEQLVTANKFHKTLVDQRAKVAMIQARGNGTRSCYNDSALRNLKESRAGRVSSRSGKPNQGPILVATHVEAALMGGHADEPTNKTRVPGSNR